MDFTKVEGIIDAIEVEHRQPTPTHANLARLTALLARTILEELNKPLASPSEAPSAVAVGQGGQGTTTTSGGEASVTLATHQDEAPKTRKRKQAKHPEVTGHK